MKTKGGWEESKADRDWLTHVFRALLQRAPSNPSIKSVQRVLRTPAQMSRVTRVHMIYAHAHKRILMRTSATDKLCGSGSYCYGYYLPLIRMEGQTGCRGIDVCVCALCVCVAMRRCLHRERDRRGSRVLSAARSWTHYRRERDRAWLQTPLSLSAPRPDPRDFQDTRHTTHKPHTLCGVNQLDPSSLRARYRYNGAAQRNFLTTMTALKCG